MDSTTIMVVTGAALAAIVLLAVVLVRRKGPGEASAQLSVPGMKASFTSKDAPTTPAVKVTDADVGGNLNASDRTGRGAEVERVAVGGDLNASSEVGQPAPKARR